MSVINSARANQASLLWSFRGHQVTFAGNPYFMGILNVTPDSFSDGGRFTQIDTAIMRARRLEAEGANLLDIGGESTRPGSQSVQLEEELRRVLPVIEALQGQVTIPISIDTTKAEVARRAIALGASIVNDISGLTFDPEMPRVCAETGVGVIAMHIQGTPQTMQQNPQYQNVVEEVRSHLGRRIDELQAAGIALESLVIDPGVGFGKTAQHNVELLSGIPRLRDLGRPVLIGHSRKRFLSKVLGRPIDENSLGTAGVSVATIALGADIVRLHEVTPSRDCWLAWQAVMNARIPSNQSD